MRNDLVTSMEPEQLKALRLIGWALAGGAVMFAVVASALPFLSGGGPPPEQPVDAGMVRLLSMAHAFVFMFGLVMATGVPSVIAKNVVPENAQAPYILRWAMVEGAALFGSVIVLIAGMEGVLPGQPVYYANLLSTVAMVSFVLTDTGNLAARAKGG
jgi:hypothetical protein